MKMSIYYKRIKNYCKKNGISSFLFLFLLRIWRILFQNEQIIFYFDSSESNLDKIHFLKNFKLERYEKLSDISKENLDSFIRLKGNEEIVYYRFNKFFSRGAVLWIAKLNNEIAGYHWSIIKGIKGFYFFPMTMKDAVLVSSEVFPKYRGKGVNPQMIQSITKELIDEGITRVFICSKIWNNAQLRSISKTNFKKLGTANSFYLLNKYIIIWRKKDTKEDL